MLAPVNIAAVPRPQTGFSPPEVLPARGLVPRRRQVCAPSSCHPGDAALDIAATALPAPGRTRPRLFPTSAALAMGTENSGELDGGNIISSRPGTGTTAS